VGKIVAAAAAQHLTPVTLELGGKSPCIVAADADLKGTARRIVWGKFINAGQTCIAPDYILADARIIEQLQEALQQAILEAYGKNPQGSPDYARIISDKHWQRLVAMLSEGSVVFGGTYEAEERYIAPTLIRNPIASSTLMQEEIFGPLLPILSYTNEGELQQKIGQFEKPLALYVFSNSTAWAQKQIETFRFGGGCINDTVLHFNNKRMPFGGVGHSGMGSYHGHWGFETFSHRKAVTQKPFWGEVPMRFAPYRGQLKIIKKIMRYL
jgi:aldehyde dehydrogenase (NAD+)